MLAAVVNHELTAFPPSPPGTPAPQSAPTATTCSTSHVAAPMELMVGGQTIKQPTIKAVTGTEEAPSIQTKDKQTQNVTNLDDERLLTTKPPEAELKEPKLQDGKEIIGKVTSIESYDVQDRERADT